MGLQNHKIILNPLSAKKFPLRNCIYEPCLGIHILFSFVSFFIPVWKKSYRVTLEFSTDVNEKEF